jgi:uncharacterized protein (TIGR00661 family)
MFIQKRILVCPLDWGLGHATRCVPIIRMLLAKNATVLIAADGGALALLQLEFPTLEFIRLKGYNIRYSKGSSVTMMLQMMLSAPKIALRIFQEHQTLKQLIKKHNIDSVISDNRYGLWNSTVKSVFITHQLFIKSPFGEKILHRIVAFFANKYDECWVPDLATEPNLSGDLSHQLPVSTNTFFIGPISRFEYTQPEAKKYDILAIVSGPEPQRSIFESILIKQLKESNKTCLLIRGLPTITTKKQDKNVEIIPHLPAKDLQKAIQQADIIIARSGYSTIMDLAALGKKAILIPTPGQTEQEYLAQKLMKDGFAYCCTQENFDLNEALEKVKATKPITILSSNGELEKRISSL